MKRAGLHIALLLILAACRKEKSLVQQPPADTNKPTLIWRVPLNNLSSTTSISPIVFGNQVAFSCSNCNPPQILFFNGDSGHLNNSWDDWATIPSTMHPNDFSNPIENHLIFAQGRQWVSINTSNNQTNWSFLKLAPAVYSCLTYTDGQFAYWYDDYQIDNGGRNRKSCVFRSPPDVLQVDTIFDYETTDGFAPSLMSFGFSTLLNGDEIILMKNRAYSPFLQWPNAGRLDVIAYNMTADSLMWFEQGVEANEGGVLSIRTLGNLAFVPGYMCIHCLDVETGQKIWDYKVEKALYLGDLIVHNNTLLYKGANDDLVCLNPYTGQEIWKVKGTGVDPKARLTLFNNKLFYTGDGELCVVDAINGSIIFKGKGDDWRSGGPFTCTPAIDPVNRRIFINNSTYAICLQMPEDW
jgi:outer membrane protein assembly factor BamB